MFLGENLFLGTAYVTILIRIVKQSQLILCFQNAAAGSVDGSCRYFAFFHRFLQCTAEGVAHHIHIDPGIQSKGGNCLLVTHTVIDHLVDTGIVRHHESAETPLLAQHIGHQPFAAGGGHTVHFVERGHHASDTCLDRGLVGQHVFIKHTLAAHVYRIIITSRLRCAIKGKVLHTSHYLVITAHVLSLIPAYHGTGDGSTEERVFAVPLGHTSPARVTADVHHRTECPRDTVGTGLDGGYTGGLLDGFHIPSARQAERNRENGFVSVYHVHTEQQGNTETALLHRLPLDLTDAFYPFQVEQSPYFSVTDAFGHITAFCLSGSDLSGHGQVELADLLLQRHLFH